jgi:hypothetical protein
MNNMSALPGIREDSNENLDDVQQWSSCSPTEAIEVMTEEILIETDNECLQVNDCAAVIPITEDQFSRRGNSAEQLHSCASRMKTEKRVSDEGFETEDCSVFDDVFPSRRCLATSVSFQ